MQAVAPFTITIDAPELHGLGAALTVTRFEGHEATSQPFDIEVELGLPEHLDPSAVVHASLGRSARLSLFDAQGQPLRQLQGVVTDARSVLDLQRAGRRHAVVLSLRPRLFAALAHNQRARVFQDKTAIEVISEVLDEARVGHRWELEHGQTRYPKLPYCVQYQESDLSFVQRLLGEVGVWYTLEDPSPTSSVSDGSDQLVFRDSAARYDKYPTPLAVRPQSHGQRPADVLTALELRRVLRPAHARVRQFDHRRPSALLEQRDGRDGAAASERVGAVAEVYDYEQELQDRQLEPHRAAIRLEQLRADAMVLEGHSAAGFLRPGLSVTPSEHPTDELNRPLVLEFIRHHGRYSFAADDSAPEASYDNDFVATPADVPLRPPKREPPARHVMETATVVGPQGEEIHVDELGRVKVQFHWDLEGKHDERSSCWVRTMQPWAGQGWGAQFLPRVGMEVLVSFVGGDINKPVVLGSLYNATHPTPFPLPGKKTQSGWRSCSTPGGGGGPGGNELRFEDVAGGEQILIHAQKDLDEIVRNEHRTTVAGSQTVRVAEKQETQIGLDHVRVVGGHEVVSVGKHRQTHVLGRMLMHVAGEEPGDEDETIEAPPEELPPAPPMAGLSEVTRAQRQAEAAASVLEAHAPAAVRALHKLAARELSAASATAGQLQAACAELIGLGALLVRRAQDERVAPYADTGRLLHYAAQHHELTEAMGLAEAALSRAEHLHRARARDAQTQGTQDPRALDQADKAIARRFETTRQHHQLLRERLAEGHDEVKTQVPGAAQLFDAELLCKELPPAVQTQLSTGKRLGASPDDARAIPPGIRPEPQASPGVMTRPDIPPGIAPAPKHWAEDDGREGGSFEGGDGAGHAWQGAQTIDFPPAPKAKAYTPKAGATSTKGSMLRVASGGLQLDSQDGIKLKTPATQITAQGGHIELSANSITLNASQIRINGASIVQLNSAVVALLAQAALLGTGPSVRMNGGETTIIGAPINLNP